MLIPQNGKSISVKYVRAWFKGCYWLHKCFLRDDVKQRLEMSLMANTLKSVVSDWTLVVSRQVFLLCDLNTLRNVCMFVHGVPMKAISRANSG